MLSAAYAILGLELRDGELVVPADLFERKGRLALKRLRFRGRSYEAPR
jgi:cyclic beta-1,2-glucan synthetase